MPKLSIIVPVYNTSKYLPICIASFAKQTSDDFETVYVNDGSTDDSLEALKKYTAGMHDVVIVDKPNGGLSSARNAGIKAASGDILAFVDSDDFVTPDFVETIVSAFEKDKPDTLVFGGRVYPEFFTYDWADLVLSPRQMTYDGFRPELIFKESSWPFAWRMAVDAKFLAASGILFDEDVSFGEDTVFQFELYPRSKKTMLITNRLYEYRVSRPDSLMGSHLGNRVKFYHNHIRIVEHIARDWKQQGYIEKWGYDLLLWSLGFVGFDIVRLWEPARTMLMNYLCTVWQTFFTPAQLDRLCNDPVEGGFASAILRNRELVNGFSRKKLFYRHTLKTEGIRPFIDNSTGRVRNLGPVRKVREAATHVAGKTTPGEQHEALQKQFEEMDAEKLAESLEFLGF
jgi:glycosyltransferase involved in cell wall biosynthesis